MVELSTGAPLEEVTGRLANVFGIVSFSPAWPCPTEISAIRDKLWDLVKDREFETFKIHARRADKRFPIKSPELNRQLGAFIGERTGKRVLLENPDLTCFVHLVPGKAYLYFERLRGAGGLPVSTGGKVAVLLSGGIDSPVAAYRILRRGCRALFIHFHSYPHTSMESQEKVRDLVSRLSRHQYRSTLYLVPFAEAQRRIVANTPAATRVILYRRMMLRIAERIAGPEGAQALVTGESIGQVASQTLENIRVISRATEMLILRPLVGSDKEDIIRLAQNIGTFPISVLPDQDWCSLFVPRHPETRSSLPAILAAEEQIDVDALVDDALARTQVERISWRPTVAEQPVLGSGRVE